MPPKARYTFKFRFYFESTNRILKNNPRIHRFKICVDAETNVLVSVYQDSQKQKDCGTLQLSYGLDQSDQIYHINCGVRGDMIKFSKNTQVNVVLYEVVIVGLGKDSYCMLIYQCWLTGWQIGIWKKGQ